MLSRKILGLALLNVFLIATVLAAFAEWQFGLSLESLLLAPARDRIAAIANAAGRDLDSTPFSQRAALLASYSERYDVQFYLTDPAGQSLTGTNVSLPAELLAALRGRDASKSGREPGKGKGFDGKGPDFGTPGRPSREMTFLTITHDPLVYWIGIRIPTNGPAGERGIPGVLLLRASSMFNSKVFFDWRSLLWVAVALAGTALMCWWRFVHGVTVSIRQLDRATEQIAEGRFDIQVPVKRADELGHLGGQINRLASRLEGFVKHQKRFLGDIAHELSAPIARIQFALGILEQRLAEPQTHVAVLHEEIQEMSAPVNELLMFSKAGMQPGGTELKAIEIAPLVQRAIAHQMPGSGTIQTSIETGLTAAAHEASLLRAMSNLLRNALRYAGDYGPISVAARKDGSRVLITVSDSGPGLPEESLEEVFTPFYRPESARNRDTGGAGLGLAIVKSCVDTCRGTVFCRNIRPSGLEVTISLTA